MSNYIKLTHDNVLNKDFEVEYKGYKVEEIDSFLDIVAEDYKSFETQLIEKDQTIKQLQDKVNSLMDENQQIVATAKFTEQQLEELGRKGLTNSAVIQRINELEKATYKK